MIPMRPRKLRCLLAATAAGAILAGTGIGFAAESHATETTFLDTLTDSGILVYDAGRAVQVGWGICEAFEVANGNDVAQYIYENTSYADVPDITTARIWVIAAAYELCPWHIRSDSGVAA